MPIIFDMDASLNKRRPIFLYPIREIFQSLEITALPNRPYSANSRQTTHSNALARAVTKTFKVEHHHIGLTAIAVLNSLLWLKISPRWTTHPLQNSRPIIIILITVLFKPTIAKLGLLSIQPP